MDPKEQTTSPRTFQSLITNRRLTLYAISKSGVLVLINLRLINLRLINLMLSNKLMQRNELVQLNDGQC